MGRYYEHMGRKYDALFSTYCEDNGIDEENIKDELNEPAGDCLLVDFDEDFPYSDDIQDDELARKEFVLEIIKQCTDPSVAFVPVYQFDEGMFEIKQTDIEQVKQLYREQCPIIWNSGMKEDGGFINIVAVGLKNNMDYLQHLVDDYSRDRISRAERTPNWTEAEWSGKHKHFDFLKTLKAKPFNEKEKDLAVDKRVPFNKVALTAVSSFGKRCTPKLMFAPMRLIDDSLERTVQYIDAAVTFVSNLLRTATKEQMAICPFQLDVCVASGKPSAVDHKVDEDSGNEDSDGDGDDDDESDYDESTYFDVLGDIKGKLDHNKLRYASVQVSQQGDNARMLENLYKAFTAQHKERRGDQESFLHRRRMVTFIDRRGKGMANADDDDDGDEKSASDKVWLFEPPSDCARIPDNAVPEWFINASRTTLLPHFEYRLQSDLSKEERIEVAMNKKRTEMSEGAMATKQNVNTSFHCFGSLLTLSFYAKSADVVKCYLYWQGQIIRFFPEDVRTVLPRIFDMTKRGNAEFLKNSDEVEEHIRSMRRGLSDKEFKGFQMSYR